MDHFERLFNVDARLIAPVVAGAVLFEKSHPEWFVRVTSGYRTEIEQRKLVAAGKSPTLRSYHVRGRAIDLAICVAKTGEYCSWDFPLYGTLNAFIQSQAELMGFAVTWGGHWKSRDAVHWQLEAL